MSLDIHDSMLRQQGYIQFLTTAKQRVQDCPSFIRHGKQLSGFFLFQFDTERGEPTACGLLGKAARTLRITGCEPWKSWDRTTACVTLHRPPPDIKIFAPMVLAPSNTTTRDAPCRGLPWSASAAKMAAVKPAAPPPTTAISILSDTIRECSPIRLTATIAKDRQKPKHFAKLSQPCVLVLKEFAQIDCCVKTR
jgi:hypothetical protein